MARDVFLSYSHEDKEAAERVCQYLESLGITCWIAPRNIVEGQTFGGAIFEAIMNCRAVVLLFSNATNQSRQVVRELNLADNARRVVVPFKLEAVQPTDDFAYFLGATHWLDAAGGLGAPQLERLTGAVKQHLGIKEEPAAPPAPRAREKPSKAPESAPKKAAATFASSADTARDRASEIFTLEGSKRIPFDVRLKAAEALGQAGDPRLREDNWIRIEGGTFWMGAQSKDKRGKNYDPEAGKNEAPVREVKISTFKLGKYPVTVAEYAEFIKAEGYKKRSYWEPEGFGMYCEPEGWPDQLRFPNRPVVSVCWYEAAAYSKWKGCRLPTEAEWEYAARNGTTGTKYPWGNEDPDPTRANYGYEDNPRRPTPVGLYPAGATQAGVLDLSGSVKEWVSDWYGKYPAGPEEDPSGAKKGDAKVSRGGAWYDVPGFLRVSYRGWSGPGVRGYFLGFRGTREV